MIVFEKDKELIQNCKEINYQNFINNILKRVQEIYLENKEEIDEEMLKIQKTDLFNMCE